MHSWGRGRSAGIMLGVLETFGVVVGGIVLMLGFGLGFSILIDPELKGKGERDE